MSTRNHPSPPARQGLVFSMAKSADGMQRAEISFPDSFPLQRVGNSFLRFEEISFSSGLRAFLMEMTLNESMTVPFMINADFSFAISFILSGTTSFYYDDKKGHNYTYNSPVSLFYDIQPGTGVADYGARQHMQSLSLHFDHEVMHRLLGEDISGWSVVNRARAAAANGHFGVAVETTPAMHLAIYQALRCPSDSPHRRLFMESKVLELITLYVQGLALLGNRSPAAWATHIPPKDRDRLYAARDILLKDLSDPPTIAALARRVGLNECKLKQMFKGGFQTTIYGFVQKERMRRAKTLLEEGMTVSQTASALGYVNFSHFAAAFQKHYGVLPSALKR